MKARRVRLQRLFLIGFILLVAAIDVAAGFIIRSVPINTLSIGTKMVRENGVAVELSATDSSRWDVSAPYVVSRRGGYCAYDLAGKSPNVIVLKEKGRAAEWLFEIERRVFPNTKGGKNEQRNGGEWGKQGMSFRMKAANGEYAGWYLAGQDDGAVRLVRDRKDASLIFYFEEDCEIGHK